MEGWIKLHRAILDNDLWKSEPFSRGQAWVDLLLLANHKESFFYKRGNKVIVKRGQVGRSSVELSDRWKWSRTKINKFLKDLEKEQQIITHKSNVTQLLTIVNYDVYQEKEQQTRQQKDSRSTAEVQQKDTYKNDKKEKKDKEREEEEERVKDTPPQEEISLSEFKKLQAENDCLNLELKNQSEAQKGKEKSSAKKEKGKHEFPSNEPRKSYKANANGFPSMEQFDEMPKHEQRIKKNYELEISKFTYPDTWSKYLISQFLEWCAGQDEKLKGKFGATHVKALIRKINGHLKNYDAKTIGDSIELSLSTAYNNFNPQWIIDRENKKKQDEQKRREQTDSNGKPLQSKYDRFNEDFFGSQYTSDATTEDSNVQEF